MTAEALALFITGLIAPVLIQQIKRLFGGTEGPKALWLAFVVSFGLAFLSILVTGGLAVVCVPGDPVGCTSSVLEAGLVVFGLATVVYKQFMSTE